MGKGRCNPPDQEIRHRSLPAVLSRKKVFHHHVFVPIYPLCPPSPFPLVAVGCACEFLLVCLVCSFVALSLISHLRVKAHGSWLCFIWLISLGMVFARSLLVANGSISSFLWLSSIPLYIRTTFLYPVIYQRTRVVSISWPLWIIHVANIRTPLFWKFPPNNQLRVIQIQIFPSFWNKISTCKYITFNLKKKRMKTFSPLLLFWC